ncbi:MAG TPA: XamI family restriction endonuclease [Thermoanaerobaculia bacterium]|nr:XamI family restriction endonuclease [Thermoanaerobaculia bacterium]
MTQPPRWSREQLEKDRLLAIEHFRSERLEEPLEAYLEAFDDYQGVVEDLLEQTVDLTAVTEQAVDILCDSKLQEVFRYLAGPPISVDDLGTVAEARLSAGSLRSDPAMMQRVVESVLTALDRRRFPWVSEGREPAEGEKSAAVLASAALMATSRVQTTRRSLGKRQQEQRIEDALLGAGFQKVPRRKMPTLYDAPDPGEFCGESLLGTRKADFVVCLWDRRAMPIEAKVSNSATNSVKRLNNDAAAKAVEWRRGLGHDQVVPVAVLSGVFKLHNLEQAQQSGLSIFWAHDLAQMLAWIESTRLS